MKTKDFYKDISRDIEQIFDVSSCKDIEKHLSARKNKNGIPSMKDELWRELMEESTGLRPKM